MTIRTFTAAVLLTLGLGVQAQTATAPPPPAAPAEATVGGVKSANIFEIAPDASADPNYARQNNGERAKVQPGNNAPVWRQVSGGVTGYSSLPAAPRRTE